jgi:flagellar motility protein MotE (MotC chaperone)
MRCIELLKTTFLSKVCHMKLIQAASAIALAAATTTALAWYAAPYQPMAPTLEQHQAMMEQHDKAMREVFEAQHRFAEQQMAWADQARQSLPEFPAMPAMPEFGQYPSAPEFPKMPEFGQYPAMPESMDARLKELDSRREQMKQWSEERRAAMKQWSEERRAQHPTRHLGEPMSRAFHDRPYPMPTHQAQAPAESSTQTH